MSTDRDTTRVVRSWLEEGVTALPDRVLDTVLDQVPTTPQRRSWWPSWSLGRLNRYGSLAGAAAAIVIVAVIGLSFITGRDVGKPSTAPPTPSPRGSPQPLPDGVDLLAPGPYALPDAFPVGITFDVPPRWQVCSFSVHEMGVCDTSPAPTGLAFLIVDNVVADPCDPDGRLLQPPVGPSVDDLVTAISGLTNFAATTPTDVVVDGYRGKQFTVTAPWNAGCELKTWATAERTNGVGAGEVNLIQILDVNATRLVITGAYHPENPASAENLAALNAMLSSVRISSP